MYFTEMTSSDLGGDVVKRWRADDRKADEENVGLWV